MEEALVAYLLASSTLKSIVDKRIHWVRSPQGAEAPRIVMYRISGLRDMTMAGPSGLVSSRVQIDCIGLTFASAKAVARAVESRLSGYSGSTRGIRFDGCFLIAERDDFEDAETPDKLHRTSLDFTVWHKGA